MTNPLGANTWIWLSPLDDAKLAELAPRIAAWGFDLVEMPIENIGDWDPELSRRSSTASASAQRRAP